MEPAASGWSGKQDKVGGRRRQSGRQDQTGGWIRWSQERVGGLADRIKWVGGVSDEVVKKGKVSRQVGGEG